MTRRAPAAWLDTSWPLNRSRSGNATASCVVDSILAFRGWDNLETGPGIPHMQPASQNVQFSKHGRHARSPRPE